MRRAWTWAVNDDGAIAGYAFAGAILGGTFAGIATLALILSAVL